MRIIKSIFLFYIFLNFICIAFSPISAAPLSEIDTFIQQNKLEDALQYINSISENELNYDIYLKKILILAWQKKYNQSLKELSKAVSVYGINNELKSTKARILAYKGEYNLSEKIFNDLIKDKFFDAYNGLIDLYYYQGKFNKAIVAIQKYIQASPNKLTDKSFIEKYYKILYLNKGYNKIIDLYKKNTRQKSDIQKKYYLLSLLQSEKVKQFELYIEDIINKYYLDNELINLYTQILIKKNKFTEAEKILKNVIDKGNNSIIVSIDYYKILSWQGNYKYAISGFEKLYDKYPDNKEILLRLASVYFWNKEYDKSYKILLKNKTDFGDNYDLHILYSKILLLNNRVSEAIAFSKKIIEKFPEKKTAILIYSANIYQSNDNYDSALNYLYQARDTSDADKKYYIQNKISEIYILKKDYQTAINEIKENITIDESNPQAYISLSKVYARIKDYEKSIELYKNIIKQHSSNFEAYNNLFNVYIWSGNYFQAKLLLNNNKELFKENLYYDQLYNKLLRIYNKNSGFKFSFFNYKEETDNIKKSYSNITKSVFAKTYLKNLKINFQLNDGYIRKKDYKFNDYDYNLRNTGFNIKLTTKPSSNKFVIFSEYLNLKNNHQSFYKLEKDETVFTGYLLYIHKLKNNQSIYSIFSRNYDLGLSYINSQTGWISTYSINSYTFSYFKKFDEDINLTANFTYNYYLKNGKPEDYDIWLLSYHNPFKNKKIQLGYQYRTRIYSNKSINILSVQFIYYLFKKDKYNFYSEFRNDFTFEDHINFSKLSLSGSYKIKNNFNIFYDNYYGKNLNKDKYYEFRIQTGLNYSFF